MTTDVAGWQCIGDLQAIQDEQLAQTLKAASGSPFYRKRCDGWPPVGRSDLHRLPLTTKQDLRDHYPFGLLAVPMADVATYHESSGTGGVPTPSFYTERDWDAVDELYGRKWVGIDASDVFLVRTPYALMITGHMAHVAARRRGATVVPADNRSAATPLARVVRVLHDLRATLTWSLPTETLLWVAAARAAGWEPGRDFPHLRAMFVAGEPMSEARRARIRELWGVPVLEEYGSTETGPLAGQCPQGQLHLWADRVIAEVYDPGTGRITPEGTGQLVVTPLGREAMPLLRYNLEDDVELSLQPCPCGWRLPTLRVLGRSALAHPVGPARVTQAALEELVFGLPAEHGVLFWRARAAADRLRVEIEVAHSLRAAACEDLHAAIRDAYEIDAHVVALPPGTLVPQAALTRPAEVLKPRGLYGAEEDWDRALRYY